MEENIFFGQKIDKRRKQKTEYMRRCRRCNKLYKTKSKRSKYCKDCYIKPILAGKGRPHPYKVLLEK